MILRDEAARAAFHSGRWPNFTAEEFQDRRSGMLLVDTDFLDRLQALRLDLGTPMTITSGYRTPEHNVQVSDTGLHGPHTTGEAADIAIPSAVAAFVIVRLALAHGFTGIGVNVPTGRPNAPKYVHLDQLQLAAYPRPALWSYPEAEK